MTKDMPWPLKMILLLSYPFCRVIAWLHWVLGGLAVGNVFVHRYLVRSCSILLIANLTTVPDFGQSEVNERDLVRVERQQERLLGMIEKNTALYGQLDKRVLENTIKHASLEKNLAAEIRSLKKEAEWSRIWILGCTLLLAGVLKAKELWGILRRGGTVFGAAMTAITHWRS